MLVVATGNRRHRRAADACLADRSLCTAMHHLAVSATSPSTVLSSLGGTLCAGLKQGHAGHCAGRTLTVWQGIAVLFLHSLSHAACNWRLLWRYTRVDPATDQGLWHQLLPVWNARALEVCRPRACARRQNIMCSSATSTSALSYTRGSAARLAGHSLAYCKARPPQAWEGGPASQQPAGDRVRNCAVLLAVNLEAYTRSMQTQGL